jgi:hypothetical protein
MKIRVCKTGSSEARKIGSAEGGKSGLSENSLFVIVRLDWTIQTLLKTLDSPIKPALECSYRGSRNDGFKQAPMTICAEKKGQIFEE